MFSTPETSIHVLDKNREISPLERERGRLREKGFGEKVSFKTRMEDPGKVYELQTWCTDGVRSPTSPTCAVTSAVKGQGHHAALGGCSSRHLQGA